MDERERLLREGQIRMIKQADIMRCPHTIMLPSHYRDDGTCKCNDPEDPNMAEWGYVWDSKAGRWGSGEEDV